jgi:GABA(A) receptor-associated protein
MTTFVSYKTKKTTEERTEEARKMKERYPNSIPIIVEKGKRDKTLPDIDKSKFLVPHDLQYGKFLYIIRKRLKISDTTAIFTFVGNNILPMSTENIANIYKNHKDEDGFLYVTYCGENTFG